VTGADLLVVGAGPAGLAGALAAARQGLEVLVVDEQAEPGGQIFRRPAGAPAGAVPRAYAWGAELLAQAMAHPRIRWRAGATAWGVFGADPEARVDGRGDAALTLAVHGDAGPAELPGRALLVATGAYDLPPAFPGWTLPGVMTAGGVQALVKGQEVVPAGRVVLAGSHPLLLVVADQLLAAGVELAEVAVAGALPSLRGLACAVRAVPGHGPALAELARALARLRAARVPVRLGAIAARAEGNERIERVRLAPVRGGELGRGPERTVACDALVLGYGFQPATELARQAGCRLAWHAASGWVVAHDAAMRTSRRGVYVAGEPTGVAGAEQSRAEGELAGLAVAADLAGRAAGEEERAARARLRHARRLSAAVERLFPPPPSAVRRRLLTDEAIACRCEDVAAGAIRAVLAANPDVTEVNPLKLACRAGMGPCQGRYCERSIAELAAEARGLEVPAAGVFTAQAPVKPVPLHAVAGVTPPAAPG
jgi:NADPH-dependent 2,4-dienoyl-CoA reductase/sulfur reductase-like enzyme